jgi:hypothetical protein
MNDVATLLGEFLDELNAGNAPEATVFIEKAGTPAERIELAQGIEAVLAFAPDSARHPRDSARGALVSPVDSAQLEAAIVEAHGASSELAEAVPSWRQRFGASVEDFAKRILAAGGLAPTEDNVSVAARWVAGMESGSIGAERLSDRAMRAVSSVLGSGPEDRPFDLAFRADDASRDDVVAEKLDAIAEVFSETLDVSEKEVDAEAWFSGDE